MLCVTNSDEYLVLRQRGSYSDLAPRKVIVYALVYLFLIYPAYRPDVNNQNNEDEDPMDEIYRVQNPF